MVGEGLADRIGDLHRGRHTSTRQVEEPGAVVDPHGGVLAVHALHLDRQWAQPLPQHRRRRLDVACERRQTGSRSGPAVGRALDHSQLSEDPEHATGGRPRESRPTTELADAHRLAGGDDQLQQGEGAMHRTLGA